jgi:hypothetical protein
MSEFRKRLFLSLATLPITVVVGSVLTHALSYWGILGPLAESLGNWLKVNLGPSIDLPGMLWGIALLSSLFLYAASLFLIWKKNKTHSITSAPAIGVSEAASSQEAASPFPPVEVNNALPDASSAAKKYIPPQSRAFSAGLHVSNIWFQRPHLAERSVIHMNIYGFNGTGEDVFIKKREGHIWIGRGNDGALSVQRSRLPPPKFVELQSTKIGADSDFSMKLEQELHRGLVEEWLHAEDGAPYSVNFDNLYIIVQSIGNRTRIARLPLWDSARLTLRDDEIATDKIRIFRGPRPTESRN